MYFRDTFQHLYKVITERNEFRATLAGQTHGKKNPLPGLEQVGVQSRIGHRKNGATVKYIIDAQLCKCNLVCSFNLYHENQYI